MSPHRFTSPQAPRQGISCYLSFPRKRESRNDNRKFSSSAACAFKVHMVLFVCSLMIGLSPVACIARREHPPLAALYPDDRGIAGDPRVLFAENFETGALDQIAKRWGHIFKKENFDLSGDTPARSAGKKSIHIKDNGHLFTHPKGVDTMFARFYVKFHEKTGYIHHFVHLVADADPKPWPKGGAGETPAGDKKFSTGIEPTGRWGKHPPPGVWNFYTYWHEMKTKWGSVYNGKQDPIQPGKWYCVEVMLKANSAPDKADGAQAFWIDGELYGSFDAFRWRTTNDLKINTFWLLYYNTDQPARHNKDPHPESRVMEVWFDDIVIATEYIGPIHTPKTRDGYLLNHPPQRPALRAPSLHYSMFLCSIFDIQNGRMGPDLSGLPMRPVLHFAPKR